MKEIGRLCIKLAGRDAGKTCVIVDHLDDGKVLIDGQTRRRPCNLAHLEPLNQTVGLKKGATKADVKKAFDKLGLTVLETKAKKSSQRPKKLKVKKIVMGDEKKPKKDSKSSKKSE